MYSEQRGKKSGGVWLSPGLLSLPVWRWCLSRGSDLDFGHGLRSQEEGSPDLQPCSWNAGCLHWNLIALRTVPGPRHEYPKRSVPQNSYLGISRPDIRDRPCSGTSVQSPKIWWLEVVAFSSSQEFTSYFGHWLFQDGPDRPAGLIEWEGSWTQAVGGRWSPGFPLQETALFLPSLGAQPPGWPVTGPERVTPSTCPHRGPMYIFYFIFCSLK